jgi:phenylalanyl-tRNA synthetase beta chain
LAVVVDEKMPVSSMMATIKKAAIPMLMDVALFDIYQGQGVAENKKSLALSVLMHDTQKTLTDSDADTVMANLLQLLQNECNATLRN